MTCCYFGAWIKQQPNSPALQQHEWKWGAIAIADIVKNSPSLKVFELSSTRCGEMVAKSYPAFDFCPTIESINVGDNTFGIESGKILGRVLKDKIHLQRLKVSDIGLEDEGTSALLQSMGTGLGKSLIELDLSCNDLSFEGLLPLGLVIMNHTKLETLVLDDNEIGSRGVLRVSRALVKNKQSSLKHLALMTCDIKRQGANALCNMLRTSGKEEAGKRVLLNGNRFDAECLAQIQICQNLCLNRWNWIVYDNDESDGEEYGEEDVESDTKAEEKLFSETFAKVNKTSNDAEGRSPTDLESDMEAIIQARNRARQKRRSIIIAENALEDSDYDSDEEDVDETGVFNSDTPNAANKQKACNAGKTVVDPIPNATKSVNDVIRIETPKYTMKHAGMC